MLVLIVILVAVAFSIASTLFVGYVIGSAQNPPSLTPGNNNSDLDCGNLCIQFHNRQSEQCVAQASERNAQARVDNLSAQSDSALKAWAIATAAALAAMFIPIVRHLISGGFAVAAGIALIAFLGFEGARGAAVGDRMNKAAIVIICLEKETEARRLLLEKCPNEAGPCLATPSPC